MEGKIIRIGNSQGMVFPAALIKQYALKDALEITPTAEGILIQPAHKKKHREGWEEKIKAVIKKHGPHQPDEDWLNLTNEFDEKEWTW